MQDLHLRYRDHPEGADASLVHCSSVRTPLSLQPALLSCSRNSVVLSPTRSVQVQASDTGYTLTIHLSFMNRFSLDDLFRPPSDDPSTPCASLVPVQFPEKMCCYVAGQRCVHHLQKLHGALLPRCRERVPSRWLQAEYSRLWIFFSVSANWPTVM